MDVVSNVAQLFLHHSANKVINLIKKLKKGHDESIQAVFRIRDIYPHHGLKYPDSDPASDPALFVSDLQHANKIIG
jgi:hypothetical protein